MLCPGVCDAQPGGGALLTVERKNAAGTAYDHAVLSVDGEGILALAEAKRPYDVSAIHQMRWETMTFHDFELGPVEGGAVPLMYCGRAAMCWRRCTRTRGTSAAPP